MLRKILNDTLWYGLTLSVFAMLIFGGMMGIGLYMNNGPKKEFAWELTVSALAVAWVVVDFAVSWVATRRILRDSADASPSNSLTLVTLSGALGAGLPFMAVTLLCGWGSLASSPREFTATIMFFVWTLVLTGAGALGSALYMLIGKKAGETRSTKIVLIVAGAVVLLSILLFAVAFLGEL